MKSFYNDREIAAICKVSIETAREWLTSGRIKSFESYKSSGNYLAKGEALVTFLNEEGMPSDNLEQRAKEDNSAESS